MLVSGPEQVAKCKDAGVLLITYSSDVDILRSGFRNATAAIRSAAI